MKILETFRDHPGPVLTKNRNLEFGMILDIVPKFDHKYPLFGQLLINIFPDFGLFWRRRWRIF